MRFEGVGNALFDRNIPLVEIPTTHEISGYAAQERSRSEDRQAKENHAANLT